MHFLAVLPVCLGLATNVLAVPIPQGQPIVKKQFVKVDLEDPPNWISGMRLYDRLLQSVKGDLNQYTADEWNNFVLDKCQSDAQCGSTLTFQGRDSGNFWGELAWVGELYWGGPTSPSDFTRSPNVFDSQAWSVPFSTPSS